MSKHISTRIVLKHDTEANWTTSTLVPLKGELIIYDIDADHAIPRFKLGDGENLVKNLPFYEEDKSLVGHTHDDRYYTESETNSKLATKLDNTTTYAGSTSVGGAAKSAEKMNITRITSNITEIAASLPVRSEAVYFGGSDAASLGCPTTHCIINIKKGDNHRTILDCYNLNTGDHYINGCLNTNDTAANPWTGWKLQPNANHTHSIDYTPAGLISQPSFTGTKATISAGYTPAGTVEAPAFTGSEVTSDTPGGTTPTTNVASSTHTHEYTPAGTVSAPKFTGSEVNTSAISGTTNVYSITAVGTLPSHTYTAPSHSYTAPSMSASVTNKCLSLTFNPGAHNFDAGSHSFDAGTLPTKGSAVAVATGTHTHKVTAEGTVTQPIFEGTKTNVGTPNGATPTISVASASHTHTVTAKGSNSAPKFTGTAATINTTFTAAGTVSKPTFEGTKVTLTTTKPN